MTAGPALRVAIVGCGLIGGKRKDGLGPDDELVAVFDSDTERASALAAGDALVCTRLDQLLDTKPDVVVVATTHDALADVSCEALAAGAHVLVEKPAGRTLADVERLEQAAGAAGRLVKVGFNHRFYPGIERALSIAAGGEFGRVMFVRSRYGHGGRLGYESEWRANPAISGGGELIDQGMHILDLVYQFVGPLPLQSSFLATSYWRMAVDDNAVLTLGRTETAATTPWATFHVSCTEWKNQFSFEVYCERAKLQVTGLARSYGAQTLHIWRMKPELGPPDEEVLTYPLEDASWAGEWSHFRRVIQGDAPADDDLRAARWCHGIVAEAYSANGYGPW